MGTSRKAERMLQLAREMTRREQELARMRAEFNRLAGDDEQLDLPTVERSADGPTLAKATPLPHRIQGLLDTQTVPLTAPEVVDLLGGRDAIDSVRTALSKLAANSLIARVGHGRYASWAIAPERGRRSEGGG